MAIRAKADNLSLDYPEHAGSIAPLIDFTEVWAHRDMLRQACARLTGDASRAEDLVQETFLSALKSGERLDRRTSIGPWLTTVARRRSIDEIRGRQRVSVVAVPPEPAPSYVDDPVEQVLNQELVAQLRAAVNTLTDRERQLLLRQAAYGMSLAELAAEEQTSVASVRSVLARARHKLRVTLERNGALGVLPVPRVLVSLRDKFARWAVQFESALPALTGVSAHVGNVVVAVLAALATLIAGGAPVPTDSIAMVGYGDSDEPAYSAPLTTTTPVTVAQPPETSPPPANPAATSSTVPSLPNGLTVPTLPPDSADQIEESSVYALTSSNDGQHIFAAANTFTAEKAIYKSSDGGATWTRLLPAQNYEGGRILLSPDYPTDPTLFAVGPKALYRSDDGGASFIPVTPGNGDALMSPGFADGDARILTAGPRILEYWDSGKVSATHATPTGSARMLVPAGSFDSDGAVLVASTTVTTASPLTGAVYRCTPAACSEPVVVPGADKTPYLWKSSSGSVFAWTDSRILRSDDDGASFAFVSTPNFTVNTLAEEPDGDILMAARRDKSASGLYRSSDNGVTWSPLGSGTVVASSPSVKEVAVLPDGTILVGGIVGGGIRCSADGGTTWTARC